MRPQPDQIGHAVTVHKYMQRGKWLARRRRGITATDVATILGMSTYATPVDVWLSKRDGDQKTANYAMSRGNALEPLLIDEWHRRNPDARPLVTPALVAHPDTRWAMASLDHAAADVDGRQTVVEAKTAGWRNRDDWWDETRLIPDAYAVQVLWQLYVTGLEQADVIADIAGDVRTLTIERDLDWEDVVVPLLTDWHKRHVIGDEPPDPDPVRDYGSLKRLWAPTPGLAIEATPEILRAVDIHRKATVKKKAVQGVLDSSRGRIRVAARQATVITHDGETIASVSKAGALTIKANREEN